eukprot:m.115062 g.115062  ORF g.115062 m.115062 type:complete len:149 (+) comp37531_c1_seq7:1342-1788(+)
MITTPSSIPSCKQYHYCANSNECEYSSYYSENEWHLTIVGSFSTPRVSNRNRRRSIYCRGAGHFKVNFLSWWTCRLCTRQKRARQLHMDFLHFSSIVIPTDAQQPRSNGTHGNKLVLFFRLLNPGYWHVDVKSVLVIDKKHCPGIVSE